MITKEIDDLLKNTKRFSLWSGFYYGAIVTFNLTAGIYFLCNGKATGSINLGLALIVFFLFLRMVYR